MRGIGAFGGRAATDRARDDGGGQDETGRGRSTHRGSSVREAERRSDQPHHLSLVDGELEALYIGAALAVALQVLKPGGFFVCKIFQGAELKQFEAEVRGGFEKTRIFKPQSSRKSSREIFILGLRKRGSETGGAIDVRSQ